ncbi:MAG: hypothetical protein UY03_C0001G0012 [Parcubacteria group bacterium GW2011_GWA2_47_64]|nr:MAG: hypothetical protein UY03_C0001G0012 [Parcubacteria group bacterium GW2011_GWA2_47_64]KKU95723.1 MAG: hypothetical protein UY29_C0020G0004 [Parcubacteria group bacterium GW2011_GWC2_48_17]
MYIEEAGARVFGNGVWPMSVPERLGWERPNGGLMRTLSGCAI